MTPEPDSPEVLLDTGDTLREARDWPGAEAAYRAYLAARPLHWQIHVQLGHAVKEQGRSEEALDHYRHAATLAPDALDPVFQEGELLRRLGRGQEAADAMARARAIAPDSPLLRRLDALLRHRVAEAAAPEAMPLPPEGAPTQIAFDVTDLLDYLRDARTPTGIQRVQMGLVGGMLEHPAPPAPLLLVAYDPSAWRWWQVDIARFRGVLELSRIGAAADDPAWRAATAALCHADAAEDAPLLPGATLASLGNAWGIEDYWRGLRMLRRRVPLRYAAFLHDCVPLAMPEHCLELTSRLYARWFAALALHADLLLANSRATAGDVQAFGAPLGLRMAPTVIPLAAEPPPPREAALAAAETLDLDEADAPFVLFVATLESRKNHLMVFQAWIELLRRLPADQVPRLVCVGRPGWRAEGALGLLERSALLRRKVQVLSGVSDLALAGLTARCLFTVYNSFHEGWGLPVSESLAAGKLCVVPAHSGLLESGAPGAVFFPPGDLPALVETLARLATDAAHRALLESAIDRAAATREWPVAAAEALSRLAAPQPAPPPRPPFPAGERLSLAAAPPPPSLAGAWGEAVREGLGWWWQEGWGCWTRDGIATLLLPLDVPEGTPVRVLLELRGPPGGIALRLRARGGESTPWRRLDLAEEARPGVVLQAEAGPGGVLVELDSGDGVPLNDRAQRRVGVGVVAVMACAEDDLAARLAALEAAEG
ncbi:glycosyltransferase [Roseomonas sp. AR75]|uniref:glycosyltransferase n=1 Tax=Roseomonas sp. AR75 TaxID=2562311 RepID=UPI0010BF8286|nr:glycosyltransferase [Roseomonas sp. AR75]